LHKNQENWDQTCDKTASQGKTMSHTQVLSGFITLKMSTPVESDKCFGHP